MKEALDGVPDEGHDPAQVEQMKKRQLQLQREMQDLDAEARKDIGNHQGTIATSIYNDIQGVVQRVAVTNGFDIVLSYPDATSDNDMVSQANIVRKLASQAAIPIYHKPHVDLTDAIVQTLNATYPVPKTPAASAPPAAGAGAPGIPTSNPGVGQPKKQ